MIYLDDVLVVDITFEEHKDNLVKVFESLGLTLKPSLLRQKFTGCISY